MNNKFIILIYVLIALIIIVYDKTIFELIRLIRFGFLTTIMRMISSTIFIFLLLILYSILLRKRKEISLLWLTVGISYIISYFLKNLFKIIRPEGIINEVGYSFPSTHAAVIFSAFAIMSLRFKKLKWVFLLIAILVAFSRLYLGVHYFSDLLAGGLLGFEIGYIISKKWK